MMMMYGEGCQLDYATHMMRKQATKAHGVFTLCALVCQGEMTALQEAPGVVAVCKKFRVPQTAASSNEQWQQWQLDSDSSSSDGSEPDPSRAEAHIGTEVLVSTGNSRQLQQQQRAGTSRGSSPRAAAAELLVEVDVVADEGLTWIGANVRLDWTGAIASCTQSMYVRL
jgi:hypothetical protein